MQDVKAVDTLLQAPGQILDQILAQLGKVGVDLPPIALQAFLLLLVAAMLVPLIRRMKARNKAQRPQWIAVMALALVVVGVLVGIVENVTTPGRVSGTLRSPHLADATLALLDFRDRVVSTDSGRPDTTSGRFALHYSPVMDGRARKLRVSAPGCKPHDFELARSQLRAQAEMTWSHQCIVG